MGRYGGNKKIQKRKRKLIKFFITCAGADIKPTEIPQTTRPSKIIIWLDDRAIIVQPTNKGKMETSKAFFLP